MISLIMQYGFCLFAVFFLSSCKGTLIKKYIPAAVLYDSFGDRLLFSYPHKSEFSPIIESVDL